VFVLQRNVPNVLLAGPELEVRGVKNDIRNLEAGLLSKNLYASNRVKKQMSRCVELGPVHAILPIRKGRSDRYANQHETSMIEQAVKVFKHDQWLRHVFKRVMKHDQIEAIIDVVNL